jgi:predicted nucleic acid-binding protein
VTYVLDACAVIALINRENGYDKVAALFREATYGTADLVMQKVNVTEVYYGYLKSDGEMFAEKQLCLIKESRIAIVDSISDDMMRCTARLKDKYRRMSLADAFLLAQAASLDATVVTSDHHELDVIDRAGDIKFMWIR